MTTGRRTVLLALADAHHGFFKGAARYAREHHWHLVADMIFTGKIPRGWRGDGIISFISQRDDLADFILSSKIPTVEISMVRSELKLPRVAGDDEMIGRLAAGHFLERGFRHYAWAPFMNDAVNTIRHRSFADALARHGLSCHVLPAPNPNIPGSVDALDWTMRRAALIRELQNLPKPLAVFGFNDCVAADILDACEEAQLPVPESVAVMGVDNDTILCESLRVPLSSVCNNLEGMAYEAAALLDLLMDGREVPDDIPRVPPTGLVTRRSTDILAVENLAVARALRFIADNYHNPLLGVIDVVRTSGISRRPLEKAFRAELSRTINEEILRVRITKAKNLLETSSMKVGEVAAATGFSHPNHLFRCFRQRFATTPRTHRLRQCPGSD